MDGCVWTIAKTRIHCYKHLKKLKTHTLSFFSLSPRVQVAQQLTTSHECRKKIRYDSESDTCFLSSYNDVISVTLQTFLHRISKEKFKMQCNFFNWGLWYATVWHSRMLPAKVAASTPAMKAPAPPMPNRHRKVSWRDT